MNQDIIDAKIQLHKTKLSNSRFWLNTSFLFWITFVISTQSGLYQSLKIAAYTPGINGWFSFIVFLILKILMFASLFGVFYFLRCSEIDNNNIIILQNKKLTILNETYNK